MGARIESGLPHARQAPYLIYCLSRSRAKTSQEQISFLIISVFLVFRILSESWKTLSKIAD